MAALGGLSTELVAGAREIRAFNRQGWAASRLADDLRRLFSARLRVAALLQTRLFFILTHELIRVAIFAVLAGAILGGEIKFGVVFALAQYMAYCLAPAYALMGAYAETQHALGAAGRLFAFLDTPHRVGGNRTPRVACRTSVARSTSSTSTPPTRAARP